MLVEQSHGIHANPQITKNCFERQWSYFLLYVERPKMENASLVVFYAG